LRGNGDADVAGFAVGSGSLSEGTKDGTKGVSADKESLSCGAEEEIFSVSGIGHFGCMI
jgi:hypothetical protein